MARIRSIKPEFWTSEQVMALSPLARLAFLGMWNFCDDAGIHPASAKTLNAQGRLLICKTHSAMNNLKA